MTRDGSDGTFIKVFVYRVGIYAVRKRFYNFPITAVTRHKKAGILQVIGIITTTVVGTFAVQACVF